MHFFWLKNTLHPLCIYKTTGFRINKQLIPYIPSLQIRTNILQKNGLDTNLLKANKVNSSVNTTWFTFKAHSLELPSPANSYKTFQEQNFSGYETEKSWQFFAAGKQKRNSFLPNRNFAIATPVFSSGRFLQNGAPRFPSPPPNPRTQDTFLPLGMEFHSLEKQSKKTIQVF